MNLTPKRKAHIDSLSYRTLLSRWRFAPAGDPWFQGDIPDDLWALKEIPGT